GFIANELNLNKLYTSHDVLLFPSRAECLPLVMIESMNYGLRIVNSKEVSLNIPPYIETSSLSEDPMEYIHLLETVYNEKRKGKINKQKIHAYAYKNFSNDIVYPKLLKEVLEISI